VLAALPSVIVVAVASTTLVPLTLATSTPRLADSEVPESVEDDGECDGDTDGDGDGLGP
jgi:hypothetical protein